jgi:MFS family permease
MIVGTQFGDAIFRWVPDGRTLYLVLFGITAVLGASYLAIVVYLTRHDGRAHLVLAPPVHRLIFRYWPGPVVLVGLMMGAGFAVTTVFLTRYATELGLSGIRSFFLGYAITAFVMRWMSRSWSQTLGRHRVILLGLLGHTAGFLLLMRVRNDWDLVLPSICGGFGHALLFPCVVSLGAGAFPAEYRGTGTTITLAFVDLGTVLSAPLLGAIIDGYGFTAMFAASAAGTVAIAAVYGALKFRATDEETLAAPASSPPPPREAPPAIAGQPEFAAEVVECGTRVP